MTPPPARRVPPPSARTPPAVRRSPPPPRKAAGRIDTASGATPTGNDRPPAAVGPSPFGECPWCHPTDASQCMICLRPNGDPALVGHPVGSVVHRVSLADPSGAKRETVTVLTGWRHLLDRDATDAKEAKGMVVAECGSKGRPYVWKGVGTRVTTVTSGVTCPRCIATPRYKRMMGQTLR